MSEVKVMNGSIFLDKEGNEVEIITWGNYYIHNVASHIF